LEVRGLVTGFTDAINLNAKTHVTVIPNGGPIPFLVRVANWGGNPKYPFVNDFADKLTMIGSPLTATNADEMVRVIKPTGTIDVWIQDTPEYNQRLESMARALKSHVRTPKELDRFKNNDVFIRRQIVANKNGRSDL